MASHPQTAISAVATSIPQAETTVNGLDVTKMSKTVEAVKANPLMAAFRFHVDNKWLDGAQTRSAINEFHGVLQDIERPESFVLFADENPILLGHDLGPNPGEYLLHALAACVTSSLIFHAAARGIVIDAVESRVEGDVDVRGFLGLDKNIRPGFQNIRMSLYIAADLSDEQLQEVAKLGATFSPVLDTLTRGVPVTVKAHRLNKE